MLCSCSCWCWWDDGLIFHPPDDVEAWRATVGWYWLSKNENSERNMSRSHFVHHKSHVQWPGCKTRAPAVRGWQLTAWAMARLNKLFLPSLEQFLLTINLFVFSSDFTQLVPCELVHRLLFSGLFLNRVLAPRSSYVCTYVKAFLFLDVDIYRS
jgi:hypothetical protein